jgi:hypothetical protein
VAQALEELQGLLCVSRQPVGQRLRKACGSLCRSVGHGHRKRQPTGPGCLCVGIDQVPVGDLLGTADLEHVASVDVRVRGRREIGDDVGERDRLRRVVDPIRQRDHREPLDQGPDQLEREAPGADHDRRAELECLHTRLAQDAPDLDATRHVVGERTLRLVDEPAEVDDARGAGFARGIPEILRELPLLVGERASRGKRVDEEVGDGTVRERGRQLRAVAQIHFEGLAVVAHRPELRGVAGDAANASAVLHQSLDERIADMAGRSRHDERCVGVRATHVRPG